MSVQSRCKHTHPKGHSETHTEPASRGPLEGPLSAILPASLCMSSSVCLSLSLCLCLSSLPPLSLLHNMSFRAHLHARTHTDRHTCRPSLSQADRPTASRGPKYQKDFICREPLELERQKRVTKRAQTQLVGQGAEGVRRGVEGAQRAETRGQDDRRAQEGRAKPEGWAVHSICGPPARARSLLCVGSTGGDAGETPGLREPTLRQKTQNNRDG